MTTASAVRWIKEFKAGRASGLLHDSTDPLCKDNERKAVTGVNSDQSLIRAYWKGYTSGMKERVK